MEGLEPIPAPLYLSNGYLVTQKQVQQDKIIKVRINVVFKS